MPLKSKSKLVGIPTADGKFRCIWCPKTYCKSKHARRHMLLHTGERPYDCPHCTMNFTRADIRKRHVIKCAQKQEDKEDKVELEPVVETAAVVEAPQMVEPMPEYLPEYLEEPQFPYYFFEGQEVQQEEIQQQQEEIHMPQMSQQEHLPQQHLPQHIPQESHISQQDVHLPQQHLPQHIPQMHQPSHIEPSKFPLLQQHPTLYAHDDHVNLSNLIDSLSQSALPLHYQLLHSDSDSLESISETSASDEGEYFEPLNWSLEGLM